MRYNAVWGLVAFLFGVAMVARLGTGEDKTERSRCVAIGSELQTRAAAKAVEVANMRARAGHTPSQADQIRLTQWDQYVDGVDRLGRGLVENFEDPWPPLAYDRWWARQLDLPTLIAEGEGCTDQRLVK